MDLVEKLRAGRLANFGNGYDGAFFGKVADELERLTSERAESAEFHIMERLKLYGEIDTLKASLTLSCAEGKREGLDAAAKIVESECARVLALQTGKQDDLNRGIDQNVRMIAVLLPDIAAAIREAAQNTDGPTKDQETIIYLEADLEVAKEKLKQIEAIVDAAPELNMSNYDVDQVAELNNAMIEIWQVLQPDEGGEQI